MGQLYSSFVNWNCFRMQSAEHIDLVHIVHSFFQRLYNPNYESNWSITLDVPSSPRKPSKIGGFIPDYEAWSENHHVIGEAKLPPDLITRRSRNQIQEFVNMLDRQRTKQCAFILCVPFRAINNAKHLLRTTLYSSTLQLHLIDQTEFDHWNAKSKKQTFS